MLISRLAMFFCCIRISVSKAGIGKVNKISTVLIKLCMMIGIKNKSS